MLGPPPQEQNPQHEIEIRAETSEENQMIFLRIKTSENNLRDKIHTETSEN